MAPGGIHFGQKKTDNRNLRHRNDYVLSRLISLFESFNDLIVLDKFLLTANRCFFTL